MTLMGPSQLEIFSDSRNQCSRAATRAVVPAALHTVAIFRDEQLGQLDERG